MGVEYSHYLIPKPNAFRPSAAQLHAFIKELEIGDWIATPDSIAYKKSVAIESNYQGTETAVPWAQERLPNRRGRIRGFASIRHPLTVDWIEARLPGDMRIEFPVQHVQEIGIRYPLVCDSGLPDDAYHTIEIHSSNDYVHHCSECIDPVETKCSCGTDLGYSRGFDDDVFYSARIRTQCPSCTRPFDPSSSTVDYRDGFTGAKSRLVGGAAYRFAIVIECGKCIPAPQKAPLRVDADFMELIKLTLGTNVYQIGDFH